MVLIIDGNSEKRVYTFLFMVLLIDGNSEHVAHAVRKIGICGENIYNFFLLAILSNALNRSNNRDCAYF